MPTEVNIPITLESGVFSEETPRQAGRFWKDGGFARFRNGLPEKVGGWSLQSNGTTDGLPYGVISGQYRATANYGAAAGSVLLTPAITVEDQDKIWLFGDTLVGGLGGRTINDVTAVAGAFIANASAAVTAGAGSAVFIDYGEQWAGVGAPIVSGTDTGSRVLVVGTPMTVFLLAGSLCVVPLQAGGEHVTTLRTTVTSGDTTLELTEPLPSPALTVSPIILMYSPETVFRPTAAQGIVLKFLTNAPAASLQLIFSTALPHNANGKNIDIRPFQETMASGDQTAVTSLAISPVTAFAITTIATWPSGAILKAGLFQNQVVYKGVARATHDWVDLEVQNWMAIGTECKLYLVNNSQLFDITPIRISGTLTNPFTTSATGAYDPAGGGDRRYVRVTHVAHQESVGNFVNFSGATIVGGLVISGEYRVTSVIDPDNYTIKASSPALTTAGPGGGSVAYQYDIDCGFENTTEVHGWGTGSYGAGYYGVGDGLTGVEIPASIWSLDNFGEDLLASPLGGPLYYWDRTLGPSSHAVLVPSAPATIQRMMVSPQARQVIAIGANTGSADVPGDPDPLLIRFSDEESFTDWISTTTNAAGDIRLDVGSRAITGVESRGDILIFTDESLHALQYVGSPLFFTLRHLGQSVAIVGPNGAVDVNGRVFGMSRDSFLIYDGVISVMECPIESTVMNDLNRAQAAIVYAGVNRVFTEVWFFYPSLNSTVVDKYAKYNYTDNCWDYGTLPRTAWADSSSFYDQKPYGLNNGRIFSHEDNVDGQDDNGVTIPIHSFLESYDMEIDSGFTMFHVARMVPDFKQLDGTISLTMMGRTYPQGPQKTKGPYVVDDTTTKVDIRMRSKQISMKIESSDVGDFWRMSDWRAQGVPHGRRGGQ